MKEMPVWYTREKGPEYSFAGYFDEIKEKLESVEVPGLLRKIVEEDGPGYIRVILVIDKEANADRVGREYVETCRKWMSVNQILDVTIARMLASKHRY